MKPYTDTEMEKFTKSMKEEFSQMTFRDLVALYYESVEEKTPVGEIMARYIWQELNRRNRLWEPKE